MTQEPSRRRISNPGVPHPCRGFCDRVGLLTSFGADPDFLRNSILGVPHPPLSVLWRDSAVDFNFLRDPGPSPTKPHRHSYCPGLPSGLTVRGAPPLSRFLRQGGSFDFLREKLSTRPNSSHEAAAHVSPVRKSGVSLKHRNQSRRDGRKLSARPYRRSGMGDQER
jgi:hypothetical protein